MKAEAMTRLLLTSGLDVIRMLLEFDSGLQRLLALAALPHHFVSRACHWALRRTKIKEPIVRHDFS
jgi:hypothetical protein